MISQDPMFAPTHGYILSTQTSVTSFLGNYIYYLLSYLLYYTSTIYHLLCSGNTGMTAVTWQEGQRHCADQGEGGNLAAIPDR